MARGNFREIHDRLVRQMVPLFAKPARRRVLEHAPGRIIVDTVKQGHAGPVAGARTTPAPAEVVSGKRAHRT